MKVDIILAGVGGQGILTIAYLLDNAAVAKGWRFKQAEVHGMSQRGGAVYSHMRIADHDIISDLIPNGQADMILSVEPLEVQRYLGYLAPGGVVVSNIEPFKNIPDYPPDDVVLGGLARLPRALLVNAAAIAGVAKMPRAQNMAMVGAATPFLPFELADYRPLIEGLFGRKGESVVAGNLLVLETGWKVGSFSKTLLDAGISTDLVGLLTSKLDLTTIEPAAASDLVKALGDSARAVAVLTAIEGKVPCDPALVKRLAG
jgi:indolepyruvate ferredoxin oxidoreductase beta subunit